MEVRVADLITPGQRGAFTVGKWMEVTGLHDLPDVHMQLLTGPVTATLATINSDSRPQLTPVWCSTDGSVIYLNSKRGRLKDRNIRARPYVTLLLVHPSNPYHWMEIYGTVLEIIDEDDPHAGHRATQHIDDLSEVYLGTRPYPLRDPDGEVRVLYVVRPTTVVTFGPVS